MSESSSGGVKIVIEADKKGIRRWYPIGLFVTALLCCAGSVCFWQIQYAIMRFQFFYGLLSWGVARNAATVILGGVPCVGIVVVLYLRAFKPVANRKSRLLVFLTPMFFVLSLVCLPVSSSDIVDPSFGTRPHQDALGFALKVADQYAHPERWEEVDDEAKERWLGEVRPDIFIYTADDLPAANLSDTKSLIIAYSRQTYPDTGVVLYRHDRYFYFGKSRAVAFADGHADMVLVADLPAAFVAHNAARAKLGLPPQELDASGPPPTLVALRQALLELSRNSDNAKLNGHLAALSAISLVDDDPNRRTQIFTLPIQPDMDLRLDLSALRWELKPKDPFAVQYFGKFQRTWGAHWTAVFVGTGQRTK